MTRCPIVVGLVLGIALPAAAQQLPDEPPGAGPVGAAPFPRGQESLLPNGLRLVVLEQHRQPVLSLTLSLPAGGVYEPVGKEGLADLLAAMMARAAGGRSADSIAAEVERAGASLGTTVGAEHLTLQADVLSSEAALAFRVLADAAIRPTLDSMELQEQVGNRIAGIQSGLLDPAALAARVFLLGAYAGHPYGRRATPQSLREIGPADVRTFWKARVRPTGAVLVVAGDIALADARELALRYLGGWKGLRPAALEAAPPTRVPSGIVLVHLPGSTDATIITGGVTFPGSDTAHYATAVLARLLSDPASGRLFRALGRDHGWTADAAAVSLRSARLGLFQVSATVPTEVADSAVTEIRSQFRRLQTEAVPAAELGRARDYVSGTFAHRVQTMGQLAAAESEIRQLGLPATYLATFRPRIGAVTAVQVRKVAQRLFPEGGTVTVVAGDAVRLLPRLKALGPVQVLAADGRPLTEADVTPQVAALTIHPDRATSRTDSLAILAQGQVVGLQLTQLTRDGDSLTYSERTALGNAVNQRTVVVFDTAGGMRRVEQTGTARGQPTRIVLTYSGGRVRGNTSLPGPDRPLQTAIDTTVGQAIVDDNAIQAILPLLDWELNRQWRFDVFSAGRNQIHRYSLTVADLTEVTVPAGTFECYRGDLEGGSERISFFVTTTPPRRLVRIDLANSPIAFVAVNP